MKILVGVSDIASNVVSFTNALTKAGYDVTSITVDTNHPHLAHHQYSHRIQYPSWLQFSKILRAFYLQIVLLKYFIKYFNKFDVYWFYWSKTFLPLKLDLYILRWMGKRVVVQNCGSDVRYRPIQEKIDNEIYGLKRFNENDLKKYLSEGNGFLRTFFNQKLEEWSGCKIISTREQATFQKKKCFHFSMPTEKLIENPKKAKSTPLIVHCPSHNVIKGTVYVQKAIELLKKEGIDFRFELIQGKPNSYVLSRLIEAAIVIDQPGVWLARLAEEGLSAGCVVVGGNNPLYMGRKQASPLVQFDPDFEKLSDVLRELILDKKKRQLIMNQSFEFWKKNYSSEAFEKYFRAILDDEAEKFNPIPNYKETLMRFAENPFQKFLIHCFY